MARQIKKKQPQKLLEQGRKEGMKDFLQKIANTSGTRVPVPFKI